MDIGEAGALHAETDDRDFVGIAAGHSVGWIISILVQGHRCMIYALFEPAYAEQQVLVGIESELLCCSTRKQMSVYSLCSHSGSRGTC